jgi:hypothetical protein
MAELKRHNSVVQDNLVYKETEAEELYEYNGKHVARVQRLKETCEFLNIHIHEINTSCRSSWLWNFLGMENPEYDTDRPHFLRWLRSLWGFPMFHAFMSSKHAELVLTKQYTVGGVYGFIIRLSGTKVGHFAVSYVTDNKIYHTRIRLCENYMEVQVPEKKQFTSVQDISDYYREKIGKVEYLYYEKNQ